MKTFVFGLALTCMLMLVFCGKYPTSKNGSGTGDLSVRVWINRPTGLTKASARAATTWDNLVIQVSAADMDTIRDTTAVSTQEQYKSKTVSNIPAGSGRDVDVWTFSSSSGFTIHTAARQATTIPEGNAVTLAFELQPVRGSIMLDFWDIDAAVDSVFADFVAGGITYSAKNKTTSNRITLAIDNVPHAASGTLSVYGVDTDQIPYDTLYTYTKSITFDAGADTSVSAQLAGASIQGGGLALNATVNDPGVFLVAGIMNDSKRQLDSVESGPVYISEIMYSSNGEEYIEIHNPTAGAVNYDTLYLEANALSSYLMFNNISIAAGGFFVVSADTASYTDMRRTDLVDLVSTFGALALRQKDSTLIDWVAYVGGTTNDAGWPPLSSSAKKAVVLDTLPVSPAYNNFGHNWQEATTEFTGSEGSTMRGTPGAAGL